MVSRKQYPTHLTRTQRLTSTQATLDDLDDPINTSTSDRAPLTGNISSQQANSNSRTAHNAQGYLNSAIPGEDRRAPLSTLDETVWETLRRDLLAVWEKMRQVLWPKYLLGGMLNQGGGMGGAERGEGDSLAGGVPTMGQLRGIVGRWPDADAVLQGGMSEGLRDWDLWYVLNMICPVEVMRRDNADDISRGPLLFCLLLSFFLSINARDDQRSVVFSGVFAMIWIAEAVVTFQIKLLGGNMYVESQLTIPLSAKLTSPSQLLLPIRLHHRLHTLPTRYRRATERLTRPGHCADTRLQRAGSLVARGRRQHFGWQRCGEEPGLAGRVPALRLLHWP